MSTIDESSLFFDEWDRKSFDLSSRMADPFCWAYEVLCYRLVSPLSPDKFDNSTSMITEIAKRTLIVLGAVLSFCLAGTYLFLATLVLGVGCKIFRAIGFALQKKGFTYVRGSAEEKALENREMKAMTWNICGHIGGRSHDHGGVVHWTSRIDPIVEKIKAEDPDVIILHEVYDTGLVEALIQKLGNEYAHFFVHLGANNLGTTSGCMVISKCAVHSYSHTDFDNNSWLQTRGFETIEIKANADDISPCIRLIGTQLAEGKECQSKRIEQLEQIVDAISKKQLPLPTLFIGDSSDDKSILSEYVYHSYRGEEPTQTDKLSTQWDPELKMLTAVTDCISLFKRNLPDGKILPVRENNVRFINCHLISAFDETYNTKIALSYHHAVVVGLKIK